jgi:hypothetical protein
VETTGAFDMDIAEAFAFHEVQDDQEAEALEAASSNSEAGDLVTNARLLG